MQYNFLVPPVWFYALHPQAIWDDFSARIADDELIPKPDGYCSVRFRSAQELPEELRRRIFGGLQCIQDERRTSRMGREPD